MNLTFLMKVDIIHMASNVAMTILLLVGVCALVSIARSLKMLRKR